MKKLHESENKEKKSEQQMSWSHGSLLFCASFCL